MENNKLKPSRVIGTVSRHAGVFVGTTAAIGKKIAGVGVSGITAVRDLFGRPALVTAKDIRLASEPFAPEPMHLEMSDKEAETKIEGHPSQPRVVESETPGPAEVTLEEVRRAVFSNSAESIIFTRAFSDISSQDVAARADAARAMAGIRHKLSVRALVAQMAREPSVQVRQECIKALTSLGAKEGLSAVENALSDRAALVRLAAVWGLYHLAGTESALVLARMCSDENEEVRRRSATCIGWLGREEFAVVLLPFLDDGSVPVRRAAVEAMGNLRSQQVVWALIEHLNDPEKSVRKAVLGTLKTITGKKMSGPFPRDKKSLQRLIARWRQWWKEVYPG